MSLYSYLIDPLLRAPTLGCMFFCLGASLMGTLAVLKKRSLLGETISHAAYPGVVCASGLSLMMDYSAEGALFFWTLGGAFIFSLAGLYFLHWLEVRAKVPSDAALCFVLSTFFGLGILFVSYLQTESPLAARQVQLYLYGQAATMQDFHIFLYGSLALAIVLFLVFAYRPLQAMLFDPLFAKSQRLVPKWLQPLVFFFFLICITLGMRSVGVVLLSGMFIAPAVAARQWTSRFGSMLILAGCFGISSGFLGNYASVELSLFFSNRFIGSKLSIPTGPTIVLVGIMFTLFSLLFAPRRGAIARMLRIFDFRLRCIEENIIKATWKKGYSSFADLKRLSHISSVLLSALLWRMQRQGWLKKEKNRQLSLTQDGVEKALKIVRLHRLWEVYLASALGWKSEQVHRNAEEIEHILTPDLEQKLTQLLSNPVRDPHKQLIPGGR